MRQINLVAKSAVAKIWGRNFTIRHKVETESGTEYICLIKHDFFIPSQNADGSTKSVPTLGQRF